VNSVLENVVALYLPWTFVQNESGDFGPRECGRIASSLDFKSRSDPKTFVFVLWIVGCCCRWWCYWLKDQSVMMMILLIERSKCDDDDVTDRKIRMWWWWCCWLKEKSMMMMIADRKLRMWWWWCCLLKVQSMMMMMMMMLIESLEYDDDFDADWKFRWWCWWSKWCCRLSSQSVAAAEVWIWRLYVEDDERLPMIYRCITLMMLMIPSLSYSYCCCFRIPFSLRGSVELL